MKINSNSNYIIFENKLQQFMLKDAEDFIQEIHYHTSQNEIIGIITYLKQNINEIAKKIHNTNYNVSEIGISNKRNKRKPRTIHNAWTGTKSMVNQ